MREVHAALLYVVECLPHVLRELAQDSSLLWALKNGQWPDRFVASRSVAVEIHDAQGIESGIPGVAETSPVTHQVDLIVLVVFGIDTSHLEHLPNDISRLEPHSGRFAVDLDLMELYPGLDGLVHTLLQVAEPTPSQVCNLGCHEDFTERG